MSVSCCAGPRFSAATQPNPSSSQKAPVNFGSQGQSRQSTTQQPKFGDCGVVTGTVGFLGCCGLLVCGALGGLLALGGKAVGAVKG